MKNLLVSALLLTSVSALASTDDTINCALSAKAGSRTQKLRELPGKIAISFDVISTRGNVDLIGVDMKRVTKEWKKYDFGNVYHELSSDVASSLEIGSVRRYTDHDVWVNRNGMHHSAIKEYKVSMKKIGRDELASLVNEMGLKGEVSSKANKSLRLKIDTEFNHKAQSQRIEFKEEGVFVNFTFSCLNKVKF